MVCEGVRYILSAVINSIDQSIYTGKGSKTQEGMMLLAKSL